MSIYAIGDVQGCYDELQRLLSLIQFDANHDILWFTGDLVNRGPQSLEVLRFIKNLGSRHIVVLGNHDLHLLAVYYTQAKLHSDDTLDAILHAPDREELLNWLRHQPLLHYDKSNGYTMVHAGLAPAWTAQLARSLAKEVEIALQQDDPRIFLKTMYGNYPDKWSDNLMGADRLRCIVNYCTRLRLCYPDGRINLSYKGEIAGKPTDLIPWFDVPDRANRNDKIIFGHWAALNGKTNLPNLFALDTGCVWGNSLTAMRLEDQARFSIKCG